MKSYQRFQCIGHTDFKGLSNAVTNAHPLLPSMGTTWQKSSCRNRLQNGPRLLSRVKMGTHSALLKGSHTTAHTPKQGPSLLRSQRGFVLPAKSLLFHRAFIYIHFPVLCEPPLYQQREKIWQSCRHKFYPPTAFHSAFQLLAQTATFAFIGKSGYTLAFANRIAHSGLHAETGAFWMRALLLPSEHFTRFGNPAWPGVRTANFAAFGAWSWVLPKNAESLRSSDALMRIAAPKASRPRRAA